MDEMQMQEKFTEKLKGLLELAKKKKNVLEYQEITDFFLVKNIEVRVGSNKKQYLDLTLADKSGDINGKKWDVNDEEIYGLSRIAAGDTA